MSLSKNINTDINSFYYQHCLPILSSGYRAALILAGEKDWALSIVNSLPGKDSKNKTLIVSNQIDKALPLEKASTQLGNEYHRVIFDAHDGFDADAFGAISGTIRGGGILFLLLPQLSTWQSYTQSKFLQRLVKLSKQHTAVFFIEQDRKLLTSKLFSQLSFNRDKPEYPYATKDQQQVVQKIVELIDEGKKTPIVITSNRGRGKSSALGITAAQLLQKNIEKIIVTAPRQSTSKPLFEHAQSLLADAKLEKGRLTYKQKSIQYWASDALIEEHPDADIVFVDEAASIPITMLIKIIEHYGSVVFSSTIHGYEGTGRGFTLKFTKVLDQHNPDWLALTMNEPVRWAFNDPVEYWVDRVLCLDAELDDVTESIDTSHCDIKQITPDELGNNEAKLSALFSLLVYAHYRTKPSDLQYLLDSQDIRIYTLEHNNKVIAALVINSEGGFSTELSSAIYRGERRPTGHMLPQTLTFHAGCEQAATLNFARIMRIAVHPTLQGQGLGSYFLQKVIEQERNHGIDIIGTSFGATLELLRFWQHANFELLRMGFSRDHVSGAHSAVMAIPVSTAGQSVCAEVKSRFASSLDDWLQEPLVDLPEEIKNHLKQQVHEINGEITEMDWQDIHSYVDTHRGYEACMSAVRKLVVSCSQAVQELGEQEQALINARIINRNDWFETASLCGLPGKNQAQQGLKKAIGHLVKKCK